MPRFLSVLLCACLLVVRAASADPAPSDRSANPFFAFGAALGHIEDAYVVPPPRGRPIAQALRGLDGSGIPFDAKQRRALQDDLCAVASATDERPDNDFEVRQAFRVPSLLRAASPAT